MENSFEHHDDHDLVVTLDRVLDALTDDRLRLAGPADRLKLALAAVRVASRVSVWAQELVAGIDSDEVAVQVHGTSTTTWLTDAARFTPREARRLIRAGEGLARFPQVSQAARAGEVSAVQAEAITGVLDDLPADFDTEQLAQGEALMVEFAHTHNSRELRMLSQHLVEVLSPETAEQSEADRLERELKGATARRCLAFVDDGHGSVLIRGSLPVADAEPFRKLIDSYAAQVKRGLEALDPLQPTMTATQRRADALVRLVDRHQQQSLAPCLGGDRPRVTMTVSWETLLRQARETGQPGGADDTGADCRGDEAAGADHATDGHAAAATGAARIHRGWRCIHRWRCGHRRACCCSHRYRRIHRGWRCGHRGRRIHRWCCGWRRACCCSHRCCRIGRWGCGHRHEHRRAYRLVRLHRCSPAQRRRRGNLLAPDKRHRADQPRQPRRRPDRHRAEHRTQRAAQTVVRRRHPAHRAGRAVRDTRRRPGATPCHRRHPRRVESTRPGLCVPRLRHPTGRLPRPPHPALVERRHHLTGQPRPALSAPPRPDRTQPRPVRRPVEPAPAPRRGQ